MLNIAIREIQIKTTMRYLTPVRVAIIKIINTGQGVEKEHSYAVGSNVNC